ncbi:MAG: short chain dehydrogenase [Acidobacteria bacterium]|nr:MAG: short chain dehydrogenase [Acidobacteriota bacterium]
MSHYFQKKVFIVTGASSGIGRSIAVKLVQHGAHTLAMARSEGSLRELKKELGELLVSCVGDVTKPEDCRRVVAKALELQGRLDGLIHNAGISMRGLAADCSKDVYRKLMEVNFFSTVDLYHAAIDSLRASRGHLVAVSSVMGRYSTQERSGYCASKHALQGYMDSIRLENLSQGVHTLVVSPGFVNTNIAHNALGPDGQPLGKRGAATEKGLDSLVVAEAILHAIKKRKRDFYPAGIKEKLGLFLSKWAPGLLDRLLLKVAVK